MRHARETRVLGLFLMILLIIFQTGHLFSVLSYPLHTPLGCGAGKHARREYGEEGGTGVKALIMGEYSGRVRDALIAKGHDAVSCDFLPTESPGPHYEGDVRDILHLNWDLMIAHPDCTYHVVSGNKWFYHRPKNPTPGRLFLLDRVAAREEAREFVAMLFRCKIPRIALENPVGTLRGTIGKPDQVIQPWMFGHGETKATCLWLRGLPVLVPTNIVSGREQRGYKMPPSSDRWKDRSRTFQGIANAMAEQWGSLV